MSAVFGAAVWRWRWRDRSRRLGSESPAARAAFGRFVGSIGGTVASDAGLPAYTGWLRARKPGALNRSYRRHLFRKTDLTQRARCPLGTAD